MIEAAVFPTGEIVADRAVGVRVVVVPEPQPPPERRVHHGERHLLRDTDLPKGREGGPGMAEVSK